jgi:hypothetical protein
MEITDVASAGDPGNRARRDIVARLRRQVGTGHYEPPAEVLAERIVQVVLACQEASRSSR